MDWIEAHPVVILAAAGLVVMVIAIALAIAWQEIGRGGEKGDRN